MNAGHLNLADHLARSSSAQPAAAAHDRAAEELSEFDRVIRKHQPQVTTLVQRLLAWPADVSVVDDIVQEVFLTAWIKRDTFRGESAVGTWLGRIAINKTRNYARKQATLRKVINGFAALLPRNEGKDDRASRGIENEPLRAALERLKPSDREIVVLRYLEEKSVDDICTLTGLKRNTVDARLSRARKRLKTILQSKPSS